MGLHDGRGATTPEKLRGTKLWVLTTGRLRPAPGQRPGWVLGAGGGRPSHCEGPGVSCILVTTCCEISCFLKTTAKKLGECVIGPQLNSWGDQCPLSLRLFRLCTTVDDRHRIEAVQSFVVESGLVCIRLTGQQQLSSSRLYCARPYACIRQLSVNRLIAGATDMPPISAPVRTDCRLISSLLAGERFASYSIVVILAVAHICLRLHGCKYLTVLFTNMNGKSIGLMINEQLYRSYLGRPTIVGRSSVLLVFFFIF